MTLHTADASSAPPPARLRRLAPALALLCLFVLGRAANANTLTVPGQYATIQAAVNAAVSGDTVLLADGTYTGPGDVDVDFGGKNLTVTSQNGAAGTVIDCQGSSSTNHRGFTLHSGETNAVIRGLTIQNGYESGNGGSDPVGGGIEVSGATAIVQNCVLRDNAAVSGGGLFSGSGSNGLDGTVTLTDCVLEGNTAQGGGGGLTSFGTASLTNCTLTGNSAQHGGGLFNFGTATLTNDILYGDTAQQSGEVYNGNAASASYCDVGEALGGGGDGVTDSGGNLNADPLFVNPPAAPQFTRPAVGDVHLRPGSPCLGAGTAGGAPATDKDGTARPNPPSIGAYELGSTLTVPGRYATIQAAIVAASPGNTVLISDGTYTGAGNVDLDFLGKNVTVTSFNGAARTIIDCGGYSTSDGSGNHRGFILQRGETHAVLSGLTVKNGYESGSNGSDGYGGGIEVSGTGVTVQNCVLQNDTAQYGGGVFSYGTVGLTNCALVGDTAQHDGGGFYNEGLATLTNDALAGDTAPNGSGGGLLNFGTVGLTNCTLTGDTANGGGLYSGSGTLTLTNDILYGDSGGEVYDSGGTASASHCDIAGGLPGGVTDNGGNISADPLFVSPPADLHLLAGSPCLGAGTPDGAPTTTLDGRTRPDPPSIGAFERDPRPATSTALNSSLNPSVSGQSVTFTAGVTGSAGTPTGSVTFTIDGSAQAPVMVDGNGQATFTTTTLSVGQHSVTATYGGDSTNAGSASGTLTQTVNPAFQVYAVNAQSPAGQTVLLSAALTKPGGVGLAGATLTFAVDGQAAGSAVTVKNGVAGVHYAVPASLSQGSHTITVSFAGDGTNPSSSGTGALTVTKMPAALTVTTASGTPGQAVTLTATLRSGTSAIAGESVTFSVDGASVGTGVTNAGGVATLSYAIPSGSSVGSHTVTASFGGDGTYASTTGAGTLTVRSAASLSVSSLSGPRGTGVTLSATLTAGGVGVSGKTVTFKVDSKVVGTAVTNGSGVATLPYAIPSGDKVGAHALGASFAGDAGDVAASGAATLTVS